MNSTADIVKIQSKTVKTLAIAQVLNGIGTSGTVAAGSLLVTSITHTEKYAGIAQTFAVLGAAVLALPLATLTSNGGRRSALRFGLTAGTLGSVLAITGGATAILPLMLLGNFFVGSASAAGYQARFAAIDLSSDEHKARHLSYVVWGSTVGAVTGPNLMQPAGGIAEYFGLPRLVGPYMISVVAFFASVLVITFFLKPDPYLLSIQRRETGEKPLKAKTKVVIAHIKENALAKFAVASVAIGHVVMVSIMVMTPVHMAHVDVTLKVIGFVISIHVIGMYAFSPLVGNLSDKIGKLRTIQIGLVILFASAVVSAQAHANDIPMMGIGLFLLGLGWSFTLVAGSTLLSTSVAPEMKTGAQGTSDLIMNMSAAIGGALAGVVIAELSYAWLCTIAMIPVLIIAFWSLRFKSALR